MQYPIIDLITSAYINNGWTGLDIEAINIWDEKWEIGTITNGENASSTVTLRSINHIPVNSGESYFFYGPNNRTKYIYYYDENKNYINLDITLYTPGVFTVPNNAHYIRFAYTFYIQDYATYQNNISINYPSTITTYIPPHGDAKNDFPNRLKLPLPHYFPHPVIDALQRAAAGTQTADDTEILRHYLTPLGIGGI